MFPLPREWSSLVDLGLFRDGILLTPWEDFQGQAHAAVASVLLVHSRAPWRIQLDLGLVDATGYCCERHLVMQPGEQHSIHAVGGTLLVGCQAILVTVSPWQERVRHLRCERRPKTDLPGAVSISVVFDSVAGSPDRIRVLGHMDGSHKTDIGIGLRGQVLPPTNSSTDNT